MALKLGIYIFPSPSPFSMSSLSGLPLIATWRRYYILYIVCSKELSVSVLALLAMREVKKQGD